MSSFTFEDEEPGGHGLRRKLLRAAALVAAALLVWLAYRQLTSVHGVPVPPAPTTTVNMLPPPPPPPPPPPQPQEKPPPEPSPSPSPSPAPQPTPQAPAPAPMQVNSAAQAGTDSYGLSAGSGTGMGAPSSTGTCLGSKCGGTPSGGISDGFYARYLSSALQERVERDGKVNRFVFSADFAIWITSSGAVSKVQLVRGSGDERRDQLLASILNNVSGLNTPPASFRFPQRITVRGRKSL